MNILALDLGTKTGYCHTLNPGGLAAGTWELATPTEVTKWGKIRLTRRADPRVRRLLEKIQVVSPTPALVVFEDVQFSTYTLQVQLWSSLRAAVWLALPVETLFECVPVATLKKFATGHGGADKAGMARYLYRSNPEYRGYGLDDNAIDAIWVYKWAKENLSRMVV